jgi:hypothetical protein
MRRQATVDVVIVSLGSTEGLRNSDDELADSLRRAGASVAVARPVPPAPTRTMALTDLAWARACRDAAGELLRQQRRSPASAVIYSSTTAALLWPRRGAIRYDAPAAANRPGRHGMWQRPLERRRLRQAPLLLPWSEGALRETPPSVRRSDRVLVVPIAVEPSAPPDALDGAASHVRDIAAITYAANPSKKGLDRVLEAWRGVRAEGGAESRAKGRVGHASERSAPRVEELVIAGASAQELQRAQLLAPGESGVRVVGTLARTDFRALLRRARVFVCAPRREDYGIAQLEALADGCQLVTTPAPGPYAALPLARELDSRLVGEDLRASLRAALNDPRADYAPRARSALAPFSRDAVDRLVEHELLPRLLA